MALPAFAQDPAEDPQRVNEVIAAEVRAVMGRRRVNQTQLARRLDMSQAALSRRLGGETPFDVVELTRIAIVLNTTMHELIPESVTGRYPQYAQVRAALDLLHYDGPDQLTIDDAPRYDAPTRRLLVPVG